MGTLFSQAALEIEPLTAFKRAFKLIEILLCYAWLRQLLPTLSSFFSAVVLYSNISIDVSLDSTSTSVSDWLFNLVRKGSIPMQPWWSISRDFFRADGLI